MQQKREIKTKAKNAILFIGDGMGIPSVTAGRILAGGEAHVSSMESLDFTGKARFSGLKLMWFRTCENVQRRLPDTGFSWNGNGVFNRGQRSVLSVSRDSTK